MGERAFCEISARSVCSFSPQHLPDASGTSHTAPGTRVLGGEVTNSLTSGAHVLDT